MVDTDVNNSKLDFGDLISYKSYLLVLVANTISRFGDSVDTIAYGWMVYKLTGSKALMGTLYAVNFIPNLLFSAFSGVFVDTHSKKKIIIIGDIGRGLVVALTAILLIFNKLEPWHLFVFTFINSTFESFVSTAKSTLNPLILPKELLLNANSYSTSISNFSQLIGLGAAGFFIGTIGISGTILVDGITFFISAIFISFIKLNNEALKYEQMSAQKYYEDIVEGFRFVRKESLILLTISLAAFTNFCLVPLNVLRPVYVIDILKSDSMGLSYISIGFLIGIIIGGIVVAKIGSKFKKGNLVVIGFLFLGLGYSLLSFPAYLDNLVISPLLIATIVCAITGFFFPFINVPIATYIQTNTPKDLLGRVGALCGMMCLSAMPLGGAIVGIVSEYISITTLFLSMGLAIMTAAVLLNFNQDFKNA